MNPERERDCKVRRAPVQIVVREIAVIGRYRLRIIRTSDRPDAGACLDLREWISGSNYEGYTRKGVRLGAAEVRALRAALDEAVDMLA